MQADTNLESIYKLSTSSDLTHNDVKLAYDHNQS